MSVRRTLEEIEQKILSPKVGEEIMAYARKEKLEEIEQKILSPKAMLSSKTKGRDKPISPCNFRTEFQRDRDRILYSRAFARLMYKTQVLIFPRGPHYRTRLRHTLEVTQVARTIARGLRLNEDLVEAIALGHDLGHSPFGHAGEDALNKVHSGGFRHAAQSVRLVESLERDGEGLNLTYEVREGILKHSKSYTKIIEDDPNAMAETLEGQIVRISDSVAYINHDIEDGLQACILKEEDLPKEPLGILGDNLGKRIGRMVEAVITETARRNLEQVAMRAEILEATELLRTFLFENYYVTRGLDREANKSSQLIIALYDYFGEHPEEMNLEIFGLKSYENSPQLVCDYIACMTDNMALETYTQVFMPKSVERFPESL